MRFFKLIIISIVVLFTITTCISLLLPNKIVVSRAIDINANSNVVYTHTKSLKNWQAWVYGFNNFTIADTTTTVTIGNSTITILQSSKEKIIGKWIEANGSFQTFQLNIISTNNATTIAQWQFEQVVKWYPWQKFASLINDKVIGSVLETNLSNLKNICEK